MEWELEMRILQTENETNFASLSASSCAWASLACDQKHIFYNNRQSYNSWFWDSGTPALPDSETPGLSGSLRGSEAPGGHLMNMNVNFANNVEK